MTQTNKKNTNRANVKFKTAESVALKHSPEVLSLVERKETFFQDVIQKTILHIQKNKILDILGMNEVNKCIQSLQDLGNKMYQMIESKNNMTTDELLTKIQELNNDLSGILKLYGTDSLENLLVVCFGSNALSHIHKSETPKFELLKKYFHPTGYSVISESSSASASNSNSIEILCEDISPSVKAFHLKVYGIKTIIYNPTTKKFLCIVGTVDDVYIDFLKTHPYMKECTQQIQINLPKDPDFHNQVFLRFIESLTLKDYLVSNYVDIYQRYSGYIHQVAVLKQKSMNVIVKEFISSDLYFKRLIITQLLIQTANRDNQYLAYLLYDILSNDVTNGFIDTQEQTVLFDSFSWSIKKHFRDAMKKTVQYTSELSTFDVNKIPLEQQICLMNVSDSVKEKAMIRLKEVKAKSEDSGTKARHYLEGLLKVPFKILKKEKILYVMNEVQKEFKDYLDANEKICTSLSPTPCKEKYTSIEILNYIQQMKNKNTVLFDTMKREDLVLYIEKINKYIKENSNLKTAAYEKISHSGKKKKVLISEISSFMKQHGNSYTVHPFATIENKLSMIQEYMSNVKVTLDKSVYGHEKAKKQISRIIGQWINGTQDGYCFGFEGPPGVGKTSLAKHGLSNCLKDEDGNSRPFAMIQMGGDSNGSTLHGHNYTYVGSSWGSIVQILMDKKCMNPIIFIDELDKISKTENGREIVGILTHLLDPTQNDCFQDKYFSGIDMDLSKALFILSYNDAELVDHILLDRIHRIKFSSLSLEDKLVICKEHILPEVYAKMGMVNTIWIEEDVLKFIINEYTVEPGVRKLKELLFEIIGEINLDLLTREKPLDEKMEIPIRITIEDVKNKYFKDNHAVRSKKIHESSKIGVINGLWANSVGNGGIIPIQTQFYPSEQFMELKLTGMQGDVMKESMNVAQTLAWSLTNAETQNSLRKIYDQPGQKCSLHVHCPEGSVPKDGPSAGTAITTVIYSLFNNRKIKNTVAITGEISLDGTITEIGGLDLKILGGIKAGVKEFIYPCENEKDVIIFMEKYKDADILLGIQFHPVSTIEQVFDMVFE